MVCSDFQQWACFGNSRFLRRLYLAIRDCKGFLPTWCIRFLLTGSLFCMATLAFFSGPIRILSQTVSVYTSYGLCFGVFAFCLADGGGNWMINKPIRHLGKVSFSAYLWHFAVLGSLSKLAMAGFDPFNLLTASHGPLFFCGFFPCLITATVTLSTLTYRLVERPMIMLGQKLIVQINNRQQMSPLHTDN